MSNPQPLAIRLRALETYPVLGQLLLGFNNYVKNLPAWQASALPSRRRPLLYI